MATLVIWWCYIFTQMSSSSKPKLTTSSSSVKNAFSLSITWLYQCFLTWNHCPWILIFQNKSLNACISATVWYYFFPSNTSFSLLDDITLFLYHPEQLRHIASLLVFYLWEACSDRLKLIMKMQEIWMKNYAISRLVSSEWLWYLPVSTYNFLVLSNYLEHLQVCLLCANYLLCQKHGQIRHKSYYKFFLEF